MKSSSPSSNRRTGQVKGKMITKRRKTIDTKQHNMIYAMLDTTSLTVIGEFVMDLALGQSLLLICLVVSHGCAFEFCSEDHTVYGRILAQKTTAIAGYEHSFNPDRHNIYAVCLLNQDDGYQSVVFDNA